MVHNKREASAGTRRIASLSIQADTSSQLVGSAAKAQ